MPRKESSKESASVVAKDGAEVASYGAAPTGASRAADEAAYNKVYWTRCSRVTSALVILFSATYMVWHNTTENNPTMCKAGALLFLLWSVLHLWVGVEGAQKYFYHTTEETMQGLIGGDRVPFSAYKHTDNMYTDHALKALLVNFMVDVGGYGVLGLFVAYNLWYHPTWMAFYVGAVVIMVADLAFLYFTVLSGTIEPSFPVVIGPIIWVVAVVVTPFGLIGLGNPAALPSSRPHGK